MADDDSSRLDKPYFFIVLALMLVLPAGSAAIELVRGGLLVGGSGLALIAVAGKWFAFWSIGIRLVTAGVRQVLNPAFTARTIFHATSAETFVVVRELGFANLCLGSIGVVSLFVPSWRIVAACSGGAFFLIAGVHHVIKKPAGPNEVVAMLSDLLIAAVMGAYLAATWLAV